MSCNLLFSHLKIKKKLNSRQIEPRIFLINFPIVIFVSMNTVPLVPGTIFGSTTLIGLCVNFTQRRRKKNLGYGLNLRHSNSNKFQVIPNGKCEQNSKKIDQGVGVREKLDNWRCNVETFDQFAIKKRSRFLFNRLSLPVTVAWCLPVFRRCASRGTSLFQSRGDEGG